MALPDNIRILIEKEINRTQGDDKEMFFHLDRRKGATPEHEQGESPECEQEGTPEYESLPESQWDKYLLPWNNFHKEITYDSFHTFYSKSSFSSTLERRNLPKDIKKARELFLYLLADRYFLFLEYNEDYNAPYPPMSEIVRVSKLYLESKDARIKEGAKLVLKHGFIPTGAHAAAHDQMCENFENLNQAICLRKQCRKKDQELHLPLKRLSQDVQIRIKPYKEEPSELEKNLCDLFHSYLASTTKNSYLYNYQEESKLPQSNYLPAIHTVMEHLDSQGLQPYSALVLFHLFTRHTKKLAQGNLKTYNFRTLNSRASKEGPPQENVRQITEYKIMLFDYLLQLLQPDDLNFIKYLFCQHTQFNGFNHFKILSYQDTYNFSCLPDPEDSIDQLGGAFRRHIRFCIPNDVSWLTPDIPNNRETNSIALATLLLQDANYLPVSTRLTDRIRLLLDDSKIAEDMIRKYQDACQDQGKMLELLKNWRSQYGLDFISNNNFLNLQTRRSEKIRQICSWFVLEYMLKERIYGKARKNLSQIAQTLFGELCLEGEVFWIA